MKLRQILASIAALGLAVSPVAAQATTYSWGFELVLVSSITIGDKTYNTYKLVPKKSNGT